MCSSLVPGGVSIRRKSRGPHNTSERNCRIMAVFLGPRQMTALERVGSRKPRDIHVRAPRGGDSDEEGWTGTGSQPPGAWVTRWDSRPRRWGMEGPVRSMSRIPTEWPREESVRASWRVMEDLPTPPLPERTCLLLAIAFMSLMKRMYQYYMLHLLQRHFVVIVSCLLRYSKEGGSDLKFEFVIGLIGRSKQCKHHAYIFGFGTFGQTTWI